MRNQVDAANRLKLRAETVNSTNSDDKIDHALAPAGALHAKNAASAGDELVDGFPLAIAEIDGGLADGGSEPRKCEILNHVRGYLQRRRNRLRILVYPGLGEFLAGYSVARTFTGTRLTAKTFPFSRITQSI